MPAGLAQVIGEFVRGDGEQVRLQLAAFVEVRQAVEEADERLLHDVFAGAAVAETPLNIGEQAAFVAGDERLPGARVALADLLDEQAVAFRCHADPSRVTGSGPTPR